MCLALFAVTLALPVLPVYKGNLVLGLFPLGWAYLGAWDYPTLMTMVDALMIFEIHVSLSVCVAAYVSSRAAPRKLGP